MPDGGMAQALIGKCAEKARPEKKVRFPDKSACFFHQAVIA